ncbi:MAG: hypothetical protein IKE53_09675 [Clostridiales bacterium]|nr:hypothetical protein [Clostridiales bacterium]
MEDKYELNLDELNEIAGGYNLSGLGMDFTTIADKIVKYFEDGGWQRVKSYAINTLHIPSTIFTIIERIPSDESKVNMLLDTVESMLR